MAIRLDILKDKKNTDAYRKFSYADLKLDIDKKRDCLITVSKYFYQNSQCIDQEINFYSCILDLRV